MIRFTRLLHICLFLFTGLFYLAEGISFAITEPAKSWHKQKIEISGKVIDASTGEAMLGVTVFIKNTTTGTITDENGNYSLTVSSKSDVIVFSFVSYEPFEIVVGEQTTINVSLVISATELEQVVVVGYGTQKKVDLTGAISTVDTKNMNLMPVLSVAQALQGRASGIQIIQNSGSPGSSTTVNIRGMGTINNSEPLYVVDGMPLEDIRFLSMDDVKDITILKDAASCAIYGSRGANGVILITTKQGDTGKIRVDFTANFSFSEFWKSYNLMDQSEWLATRKIYYQGSPYEDHTKYFTTKYAVGDWFDEVTNRYGANQKYNITISGGSEKTKYLMSITNTSDDGIVKKSSFRQTTFRLNIDNHLNNKVTLLTNLNFANSSRIPTFEGKDNIFQQVLRQPPVDRIHEALYDNVDKPDSVVLGPSYIWGTLYAKLHSIDNKENTNNLTGLLNLIYTPVDAISINSRVNVYANFWEGNYFYKSPKSFLYLFNSWDKNNITKQIKNNQAYRWSWENILHASKKFAGLHNIDFTGVFSIEGQFFKETDSKKYGYISDSEPLQYLNAGNNIEYTNEWAKLYTTMSFVGRVIYDFSDKYNLQLNARGDGSSFFSESRRW
ncbi:MAG: SusC/RagA family TonB-linked outer membrane protein, partial [Bacteroidales bacterium]|nr:SusC/RagA family TonB-linked outer membrane protein [Bacteroidales bacterium]